MRTAAVRTAAQRTRLNGTRLIGMGLNGIIPLHRLSHCVKTHILLNALSRRRRKVIHVSFACSSMIISFLVKPRCRKLNRMLNYRPYE